MGVIEIEYELNKINVFTKSDEEPHIPGIGGTMATGLSNSQMNFRNFEWINAIWKFEIVVVIFF